MPGFIKTPADERKWQAIKHSVAKQRGKKVEDFTDRDWATVNAAWHKSEGNTEEFDKIMKSIFISASSGMSKSKTSIPKANKGTTVPSGLKMPKPKMMPKITDKPSVFFKSEYEEFEHIKHPTLCKLRDFLKNVRLKKQS